MFLTSCSEKEPVWGPVDLYKLAQEEDPKSSAVLTDLADTEANLCLKFKYGDGCQKVIRATILGLEVIFVEFMNTEQAKNEARRIGQMYTRNWVIDDVSGEPALERFMVKVYEAIHPLKEIKMETVPAGTLNKKN